MDEGVALRAADLAVSHKPHAIDALIYGAALLNPPNSSLAMPISRVCRKSRISPGSGEKLLHDRRPLVRTAVR